MKHHVDSLNKSLLIPSIINPEKVKNVNSSEWRFSVCRVSELDSLIIQPSSSLLDSIITTYLKTNEFLEFLHKQIKGCSLVLEFGLLFSRC